MVKERLSKLQKWILEKCLKDLTIYYQDIFIFFGKRFTKRKPDFIGRHNLKTLYGRIYGEDYKKVLDIEKIERKHSGYVWQGYKISRKPEFCITNSEKAIISRSLKGLVKKGYLIQPSSYSKYRLTKEGLLKANKKGQMQQTVSFKDYQRRIAKAEQEAQRQYSESVANITEAFKNTKAKS